ncbi:hypothetical protein RYX36_012756, partial [Vicia faba]
MFMQMNQAEQEVEKEVESPKEKITCRGSEHVKLFEDLSASRVKDMYIQSPDI